MFIVEGKDKLSKVGKVKIIKIRLVYGTWWQGTMEYGTLIIKLFCFRVR